MRIGIFTDTYLPDINGVVTSIEQERIQLENLGHEVFIITSSTRFLFPKWKENVLRLAGFKLPKKMYNYKLSSPYSFLASRTLKKKKLDVIHAHTEMGVGLFARLFSKLKKIPLVYTYHTMYEDYTHYIPGGKDKDGMVSSGVKKLSKAFSNSCDEVIAPTEKTRNRLRMYGVEKYINVIPTGLDLEKFNPANYKKTEVKSFRERLNHNDELIFMFVGRVAKEKNIKLILEAIKPLAESSLAFKFLIIGGGPHVNELQDIVKTYKLGRYVKFLGKVPNDQIGMYYQISDVFITASTSETQGLTFIEAMASRKPVLAAYDEASKEIIDDGVNGWFFKNKDDLKDKMLEIINMNRKDLDSYGINGLIKCEKYDAVNFGKKIEDVLKRAIDLRSK